MAERTLAALIVACVAVLSTGLSATPPDATARGGSGHGRNHSRARFVPRGVSYDAAALPAGTTALSPVGSGPTDEAPSCATAVDPTTGRQVDSCHPPRHPCAGTVDAPAGPPTRAVFRWTANATYKGVRTEFEVPATDVRCAMAHALIARLRYVSAITGVVSPATGWRCSVSPQSVVCFHGRRLNVRVDPALPHVCAGRSASAKWPLTRGLVHWDAYVAYPPLRFPAAITADSRECAAARALLQDLQGFMIVRGTLALDGSWTCRLDRASGSCDRPDGLSVEFAAPVQVDIGAPPATLETVVPNTLEVDPSLDIGSYSARPRKVHYFLLVGREPCGDSVAVTEQAMLRGHGLVLALGRSKPLEQTLFLQKLPAGTYHACYFLQRSGADVRAKALARSAGTVSR